MNRQVIIAVVALAALAGSFVAEMFFPICSLCLLQRIVWALVLATAVLWMFKDVFRRVCRTLLAATFLIASYHSLVQLKLIDDRCHTAHYIADAASYKTLLTTHSCLEGVWDIAGIPASMWSAFASLILFRICKK